MLPEGWTKERVKDRGEVQAGRQRAPSFLDGEMTKYLRVANVFDGYIDTTDVLEMPFTPEERSRYLLSAGDLLLNEGQSLALVGRPALYLGSPADCCFQNTLIRFRPGSNTCSHFALQKFRLCLYDGTFKTIATQTTSIAHLGVSRFANLKLAWPPLVEQRRIVEILAAWDEAIGTTHRLLANSRQQKLSVLNKTLRIPAAITEVADRDRSGTHPPSVRAGIPRLPQTPSGWQRVHLGKHLREVRRPVTLEPQCDYTLVTVKRSRGGVHRREVLRGSEVKTHTQFIVKAGDFLMSKRQIVHGACGIVPPELDGAVVSNEYAVLNSDGGIDLNFLRYLSESIYFQQTCFHSSIGVHVEKMIFKTERWLAWPFNIPPLSEQRRIVEVLDAATAEVAAMERQLGALKLEKESLMQQLLTGKRRVHLTEAAAETTA